MKKKVKAMTWMWLVMWTFICLGMAGVAFFTYNDTLLIFIIVLYVGVIVRFGDLLDRL